MKKNKKTNKIKKSLPKKNKLSKSKVKVTVKVIKKTPVFISSESDHFKNEMKEYKRRLKKIYGESSLDLTNQHPSPSDDAVKIAEQGILGENYEKVMSDVDTKPTISDAKDLPSSLIACTAAPTKDYGVLADVAVKFGISLEAFNKLISFMISNEIVLVGNIIDYNTAIKTFISKTKRQKRIEELEKQIETETDSKKKEELSGELESLKSTKYFSSVYA